MREAVIGSLATFGALHAAWYLAGFVVNIVRALRPEREDDPCGHEPGDEGCHFSA